MPLPNKILLMKPSTGLDVDEIEFEIGLESSIRKEGGELEEISSGCNIFDSQIMAEDGAKSVWETKSPQR
jgi:hypothetical protein